VRRGARRNFSRPTDHAFFLRCDTCGATQAGGREVAAGIPTRCSVRPGRGLPPPLYRAPPTDGSVVQDGPRLQHREAGDTLFTLHVDSAAAPRASLRSWCSGRTPCGEGAAKDNGCHLGRAGYRPRVPAPELVCRGVRTWSLPSPVNSANGCVCCTPGASGRARPVCRGLAAVTGAAG
jgi:hypothetical protein